MKQIGWFSYGADGGSPCFHDDVDRTAESIKDSLDHGVTGGPFTVVKAFVEVEVLPYMGKPPLSKYQLAKKNWVPPTVFTNGTRVIQARIEDEE
jgi:hypothetical protein